MKNLLVMFLVAMSYSAQSQLKYLVEDFEGFADHPGDLKPNGVFGFGNGKPAIGRKLGTGKGYSGERCMKVIQESRPLYGGWGKGLGMFVELDPTCDHFNFYLYRPSANPGGTIRVELQDDDNGSGKFEKESDDTFEYPVKSGGSDSWELISIPLNAFSDSNPGGDGSFNISYKKGKLLNVVMNFETTHSGTPSKWWAFDFLCFSKGKLPVGRELLEPPGCSADDKCSIGAWSKEGNTADFSDIALNFEANFKVGSDKKLGVVHFFQPFAVDGGSQQNLYPSVERINGVIARGYVPLITLEDHFVNAHPGVRQPNLYSIVEGHFDIFFADWANRISQVDGVVMLRILHEFNGDWYPWCIAKNDQDPALLIKAFRHICSIFREQKANNVRFIWCPNSTSFPQESWNHILLAYPGDEYVDFVGLDIYNGAGSDRTVWRSFRKEGIENYFLLTQNFPDKPILVCEAASRERRGDESQTAQSKSAWIGEMSETLNTDMSAIRLLTWFNEKESFRVNSSPASHQAFLDHVMKNKYFLSGSAGVRSLLKP